MLVTLAMASSVQTQPPAEISGLRHHQHADFFRLVLEVTRVREYSSAELSQPDRLYLDIYQARLNSSLQGKTFEFNSPCVRQLRLAQRNPTTVRVTFELQPGTKEKEKIYYLKNPDRLVIDIYHRQSLSAAGQPVGPEGPQSGGGSLLTDKASINQPPKAAIPTTSGYSLVRQLGLGVKKIALDPGHGGTDPGCLSQGGLKEKDVALDLAKRLKSILETQGGFEVFLTRETDISLPLEKRTKLANEKQADLFISIHLNASPRKTRTGVETFYLNFSPDPAVNELAARENASSSKNIREMKQIVDKIVKNTRFEESRALAEKIHRQLLGHLKQHFGPRDDLGVKGGPFWVLIGSEMPAVLVEVSHLSNAKEEEALKTDLYREAIATGLFRGIIEYVKSLGKGS
ncbi:MAG TPA: N-acetylmuramoyl-L-alanine amidase [Candidatus Saccharicenans sp.]|nr:N-acetylmuramoyl-L-alanine amidase [Candidatus Saccharicenans sp.]